METTADAATDIIDAKGFFDGLLTELKQELISKTKAAFLPENDKKASKKTTLYRCSERLV
ncbi:MAG: hypothetical protein ACLUFI_03065 [Oscillospiraceae bacterium]